jgi:lipopolysaccharide/colanic/teichoic acid biosynthesis glycosyltransferase
LNQRALFFRQYLDYYTPEQARTHEVKPGITGWAQINGRDDLPIPIKVGYDEYYLKNRSFFFDIKILFLTLFKTVKSEGVQH